MVITNQAPQVLKELKDLGHLAWDLGEIKKGDGNVHLLGEIL